jgi:hypothetical protein
VSDDERIVLLRWSKGRRTPARLVRRAKIVVVEHTGGVTICAVYLSSDSEPNECAPGDGGRSRTRNNDIKVRFDVLVPAGVRFAGRMVNAAIRAEDLTADVRARTVNGSAWLSTSGGASATTVNESIRASFGETWDGEATFETVNGSIRLEVPEQINADVEIRTSNGRITTDGLSIATTRSSRRRVEGTLGEGGPDLRLKTVNGSITLRPAE